MDGFQPISGKTRDLSKGFFRSIQWLLFAIGYGSGARARTDGAMHSEAKTLQKDSI